MIHYAKRSILFSNSSLFLSPQKSCSDLICWSDRRNEFDQATRWDQWKAIMADSMYFLTDLGFVCISRWKDFTLARCVLVGMKSNVFVGMCYTYMSLDRSGA